MNQKERTCTICACRFHVPSFRPHTLAMYGGIFVPFDPCLCISYTIYKNSPNITHLKMKRSFEDWVKKIPEKILKPNCIKSVFYAVSRYTLSCFPEYDMYPVVLPTCRTRNGGNSTIGFLFQDKQSPKHICFGLYACHMSYARSGLFCRIKLVT